MAIFNQEAQARMMIGSMPYMEGDILSVELSDRYGYEYRPCVVTSISAVRYAFDDYLTIDVVISWFDSERQQYRSALIQNEKAKNAKILWTAKLPNYAHKPFLN